MTVKQWLEINRKIDVYAIARKVIEETEADMVGLNRTQLMHNLDSKGNPLGGYMSRSYQSLKIRRGGTGEVDLFLYGGYQRSIFVEANGKEYFYKADDWKADKLADKYGEDILGLPRASFNYYRITKFMPLFARKYEAARKGLSTL